MPILMLALATTFICLIQAHAQQEVDPDHFDQPAAYSVHARASKARSHPGASTAQRKTDKTTTAGHTQKLLASAQKPGGK
jgi:hypothetical protein